MREHNIYRYSMKLIIKAISIVTLSVVIVLVIAISFVRYELSKDHEKIKKSVKDADIEHLVFDFCYENKCFYKHTTKNCTKRFMFGIHRNLNAQLSSIKLLSEDEVCEK